jgi:uncharacterized protein (DUF2267 family)
MTIFGTEAIDGTIHKTNEWLRDIAIELGEENRRHAYLALRGTLHAIRDFLPVDESAQLSAQLPMLVRGIYFEGWRPSTTPEAERTRARFLSRVESELKAAMWNEAFPLDPEEATRAVLRVLAQHISGGEIDQVRQTMPKHVRELWPEPSMAG